MSSRKWALTSLAAFVTSFAFAQDPTTPHIVQDHYTVSGGFLGAANWSSYRVSGGSNVGKYKLDAGWSTGLWLNFPVSNGFSVEPQFQYNSLGYKAKSVHPGGQLMVDGSVNGFSVPVNLKFHVGPKFAIAAGPQVDWVLNVDEHNNANSKDNFKSPTFSAFAGVEFFPHGFFTIFGRYVHGFTNNAEAGIPNSDVKYFNQQIQVGLKMKFFGRHIEADSDGDGIIDRLDACPNQFGLERYKGCPIPDTDKDGLNDEVDKCPTVAGLDRYQGCPIPDTDKDGINDEVDKCPTVAGLPKYNGCPIPDTDGDGINDEEDKCPTVAGLAKYQGCPIPDTDGDGINDEEDRCPKTPGVPEMKGCPKIATFEASEVTFASGKSVLTVSGKKELDLVVAFLKNEAADAKVHLVGHTDNSGNDKINDPLSVARAKSAKDYLVSQGIDESRINIEGKGSHEPVADNKTNKGKQLNRRVEITID